MDDTAGEAADESPDEHVLDRVASIAEGLTGDSGGAIASARRRAASLAQSLGGGAVGARAAAIALLADIAFALVLDADEGARGVRTLVDESAAALGLDADVVGTAVVVAAPRSPSMLQVPPHVFAEAQLRLLLALAGATHASLWTERAGAVECIVSVGAANVAARARAVAAGMLADAAAPRQPGLFGVPIEWSDQPIGALVVGARADERDRVTPLAHELAPALAAALEKRALLERNAARERSLLESTERRLVRLGLDLHDGPLQDLAALLSETRLLRSQLESAPSLDDRRPLIVGRLDDFEARVVALEADIRAIIQPLEHGSLVHVPFFELVEREVSTYADATLDVALQTRGRAEGLTQSQRLALLRVVEEALANVRAHSGATTARVVVSVGRSYLRAEVQDDGRGFDVGRAFADAVQSGSLGLSGMAERVRLLGGRLEVRSRPGGPTTVSAVIPRWHPPESAATGAP